MNKPKLDETIMPETTEPESIETKDVEVEIDLSPAIMAYHDVFEMVREQFESIGDSAVATITVAIVRDAALIHRIYKGE